MDPVLQRPAAGFEGWRWRGGGFCSPFVALQQPGSEDRWARPRSHSFPRRLQGPFHHTPAPRCSSSPRRREQGALPPPRPRSHTSEPSQHLPATCPSSSNASPPSATSQGSQPQRGQQLAHFKWLFTDLRECPSKRESERCPFRVSLCMPPPPHPGLQLGQ